MHRASQEFLSRSVRGPPTYNHLKNKGEERNYEAFQLEAVNCGSLLSEGQGSNQLYRYLVRFRRV